MKPNRKNEEKCRQAMLAGYRQKLDRMVEAGRMTPATAEQFYRGLF